MKKFRLIFFCFLFFLVAMAWNESVLAGFEDRRFEKQRLQLAQEGYAILIRNNICENVNECRKAMYLFASPMNGGFSVQIWGVRESSVFEEISTACARIFIENKNIREIDIRVYFDRRDSVGNVFLWNAPKYEFNITYRRDS